MHNQITVIPVFPEFRAVDLSLQGVINDFLSRWPIEASEYTFTNIFAFSAAYNFKVSLLEGNLILLKDSGRVSAFCPVGNSRIPEVLDELFDYLGKHGPEPAHAGSEPFLERIPGDFAGTYLKDRHDLISEEDRDQFDYVYDARELIELKGNRFHDKRNQVNRFRGLHKYEYIKLTPDLIGECLRFEDYWCEVKECEKDPGLKRERCAILRMLKNFESLGIKGGAIAVDNKIAAITLGERFLTDSLVIHVEKANPHIPGLYQVINQEFLMREGEGCNFVNREQDLGIEGLRKAKMSYNPVGFLKKYKVSRKAVQ